MKVFNVLVSVLTLYFTYKNCVLSGIRNGILPILFFVCAPVSFALTFSGLTEPLFALLLIVGVYLSLRKRWIAAAVVISFLPFVRSEGLIICGVFTFYFLFNKSFKTLPWLLTGHLVYSIAGYFVYEDILWVFTKIPYAHISSVYGSGGLFHFANEMAYLIGIPIYILMIIGIIVLLWKGLKKEVKSEIIILVGLGFLGFFVAHTLFWFLGIFNSMGLKRVFVGVMPLIAILALYGFNFLVELSGRGKRIVYILLLVLIALFPFSGNHAALHVDQDLKLNEDQKAALRMGDFVRKELGTDHRFLYSHPYISLVLDIDHFDPNQHYGLSPEAIQWSKAGDIIVWDNWFGEMESGVSGDFLESLPYLRKIHEISEEGKDRQIEYAVYERI